MNRINIFTSYFSIDNKELDQYYTKTLLPKWIEKNSQFSERDSFHIYTNVPEMIECIPHVINMDLMHAKFGDNDTHIMSTQIMPWVDMTSTLAPDEVAIYLDPDAFMMNDRLVQYAPVINEFACTRKLTPWYGADVGVFILKNRPETFNCLNGMIAYWKNNVRLRNVTEAYYDLAYDRKPEHFIDWRWVTIQLRDVMCGFNSEPDVIHGVGRYSSGPLFDMLRQKEALRAGVY